MPSTMREIATSTVNGTSSGASHGNHASAIRLKLTACRVCPEGKLNSSSGAMYGVISACARNGRGRFVYRLSVR